MSAIIRNEKTSIFLMGVLLVAVAASLIYTFTTLKANLPLTVQIHDKANGEAQCDLMLPSRDDLAIEVHRCITNPDGSRSATITFTDKSPQKAK